MKWFYKSGSMKWFYGVSLKHGSKYIDITSKYAQLAIFTHTPRPWDACQHL